MSKRGVASLKILLFCILPAVPGSAVAQCSDASTQIYWIDSLYRTAGNNVEAVFGTQIVGDYSDYWAAYVSGSESLGSTTLNNAASSVGYGGNNVPGSSGTAAGWYWNYAPQATGAGTYNTASYHQASSECSEVHYTSLTDSLAVVRPTVAGVSAFWWLGGVTSDRGYYAQALWTANSNGAPGTPTWVLNTATGGGAVSLSCTYCSSTTATSTAPSNGCTYDITVYANYDGFYSDAFNVAIVKPSLLKLQSGYPVDAGWGAGYTSTYQWALTDTCGNPDSGLDANEQFGTWTDDYYNSTGRHNDWPFPTALQAYSASNIWEDQIGATGTSTPASQIPSGGNVAVKHNYPWTFYFGSQTFGSGLPVYSDTQQFYQDHGRHF